MCTITLKLIAVASVVTLAYPAVADADVQSDFKTFVQQCKLYRSAIESIQLTFAFEYHLDNSHNAAVAPPATSGVPTRIDFTASVHYVMSGSRLFEDEAFNPPLPYGDLESAWDGHEAWQRTGGTPGLLVSNNRSKLMGQPSPLDVLEVDGPEQLLNFVQQGALRVVSVEPATFSGETCTHVVLTVPGPEHAGLTTEIYYARNHGLIPIRRRSYYVDGNQTTQETRNVSVGSFTVDGNVLFYPVAGEIITYSEGFVMMHQSVRVDPATVRINQSIPASTFVLKRHPEETLFDSDTQRLLVDPGKQLDVDTAIRSTEGRPIQSSVPSTAPAASPTTDAVLTAPAVEPAPTEQPAASTSGPDPPARSVFANWLFWGAVAIGIVGTILVLKPAQKSKG